MIPRSLTALAAVALMGVAGSAAAAPVTTGVVIRGLTLVPVPVPPPASGTPVSPGRTCDFSREPVNGTGHMTDASVQCKAGGNAGNTTPGMAANFTAYCVIDAKHLGGARVITAPVPGNANHCLLSGMKPKAATTAFGGAKWR